MSTSEKNPDLKPEEVTLFVIYTELKRLRKKLKKLKHAVRNQKK